MNLLSHATLRYWTFSSKGNVDKSSFGLCSLAPVSINESGAQKQRPHKLLWTLWFDEKIDLNRWINDPDKFFISILSQLQPRRHP